MEKEPEITRTSLRIPKGMYEKLAASAEERGLTMHADILRRIQDTLDEDEMFDDVSDGHGFLRLPEELIEKISAAAKRMNRTPEAQALDTLEKAYMPPKP